MTVLRRLLRRLRGIAQPVRWVNHRPRYYRGAGWR